MNNDSRGLPFDVTGMDPALYIGDKLASDIPRLAAKVVEASPRESLEFHLDSVNGYIQVIAGSLRSAATAPSATL